MLTDVSLAAVGGAIIDQQDFKVPLTVWWRSELKQVIEVLLAVEVGDDDRGAHGVESGGEPAGPPHAFIIL